jgi:hypothetical protein
VEAKPGTKVDTVRWMDGVFPAWLGRFNRFCALDNGRGIAWLVFSGGCLYTDWGAGLFVIREGSWVIWMDGLGWSSDLLWWWVQAKFGVVSKGCDEKRDEIN